jgi:predicted Rossmann fold nucleotide-binding protein DprA/Smf involved in DNA uptake
LADERRLCLIPRRPRARNHRREAIQQGRLLLLSPFTDRDRRATAALSAKRNRFVAALSARILIAHAAPGGTLMELTKEALEWGKPVYAFDDPANTEVLEQGARRWCS